MPRRPSVTFVVMAGGRGERLWPLVRAATPKVCLKPDGTRSLLQATIDRLRPVWPGARWLIVTTQGQAQAVRRALPPARRRTVLVEPQIKNTAACLTVAAAVLAHRDPHQVMVAVPADHWVPRTTRNLEAYRRSLRAAIDAAVAHETIVMMGIRPTRAHAGFGYLCAGSALGGFSPTVFRVERFVEKPSRAVAARLLRRQRTFWNSGTFVATAQRLLESVSAWLPAHARKLIPLGQVWGTPTFARRAAAAYHGLRPASFDEGVMNHVTDGLVVDGRFQWADLGSWDAWARVGGARGRTVAVKSRNVAVVSHARHLVATIGVRDLAVIQTPSATLICRLDQAQAVREVTRQLSENPRWAAYR